MCIRDRRYAARMVRRQPTFSLTAIRIISPGALQTLGTPLLVGRDFRWEEIDDQRNVAMVSESFARAEWSTVEGAIGKRVLIGTSQTWQEVIAVVADVHDAGSESPAPQMIYLSL